MDNNEMKRRVLAMFDSIVNEVDPKGHILDCLLQQDIVSFERRGEIEIMKSRFERARAVLWHLLESQGRHPSAYVDFVTALKHDYQHLAIDIRTIPYDQLLPRPRFDNEAVKKVVEKQFLTKINSEIDPKLILDYMYKYGLVDMETLTDINDPSLKHQQAKVFTDHLRTYSDPHAYARFLEALEIKYPHLAKNIIDAMAKSTSGSGARARNAAAPANVEDRVDGARGEDDLEKQVFLSHSSKDKPMVRKIRDQLNQKRIGCWLDEREMGGGDSLGRSIEEGIARCKVVVACVTPDFLDSDWCRREVLHAFNVKKPPIFIMLKKTDWPPLGCGLGIYVEDWLYTDFTTTMVIGEQFLDPEKKIDELERAIRPKLA